jgi:glycosyltransferase involved in cell wall biosynthesis
VTLSKLMLVTPPLAEPSGGRALLSHLHYQCLKAILGDALVVRELEPVRPQGAAARIRSLKGYIDGLTPQTEAAIVAEARAQGITRLYLNGSNLGRLARTFRRQLPGVQILTFFHNSEARFFLGALRQRPRVHALAVLAANFIAERSAVRASTRLIALSERDSQVLKRLYGRGATDILPMAVEDKLPQGTANSPAPREGDYALFVGGAFYANEAGISWYADNVAPHVPIKACVIGRGLEPMRGKIAAPNVEIVGGVDDLAPWYRHAKVVIAPIFDGSGMKTKVAEALMFGKKLVGTPEAFSGYEAVAGRAGWLCTGKAQFIQALQEAAATPLPPFDPVLRELYVNFYSREAATRGLAAILNEAPAHAR